MTRLRVSLALACFALIVDMGLCDLNVTSSGTVYETKKIVFGKYFAKVITACPPPFSFLPSALDLPLARYP
jgi:hypothetical protein